ncbi:MAG: hypothetical protein AMJ84_02355 [Acidithiobacillales bacterium SM23_46]|nr:MAG: hypothetical protein AMJ84_02355 [Acidithiobacillales bacterium SM23_46]
MPAYLPGATAAQNAANPSQGPCVIFDPLSGPKASPFDKGVGTGALCTGIGFGSPPILGDIGPQFTDDYIPGQTLPSGDEAADSSLMYIGGGRSEADGTPDPYDVSQVAICMAGNGGSRDGGTTPFTGFAIKTVTATGAVANGAAVETGWSNRSGVSLVAGQSVFGSSATQLPDVA